MAGRQAPQCALLALLVVAAAQLAAAGEQGFPMGLVGKGSVGVTVAAPTVAMPVTTQGSGNVDVDVQCNNVCNDVCAPVPNKVCNEVPYQAQVCKQVPVQKVKQVCNRVCTKTTTVTETVNTGKGGGVAVMAQPTVVAGSVDASVDVSMGKGRRLAGAQKAEKTEGFILGALAAKAVAAKVLGAGALVAASKAPVAVAVEAQPAVVASVGKGDAPKVDVQCNDVCNDVPYTDYTTACDMVTQTKTKCDIVFTQKCDKVCKPVCKKITTYTTTTTTTTSTGKGGGVAVAAPTLVLSKGKGV